MRSKKQKILDFVTFPLRAITLFIEDKWGLSCLATERYDYASKEILGNCLDVGCGPNNRFIREFLHSNGIGIDVFEYEGLSDENIVRDMTQLPYEDGTFDSVTFLANINHIPKDRRDSELMEAYRVLRPKGNIIVTMGNPLAEILVHKAVTIFDFVFKTHQDVDLERGMEEGEEYYLTDSEITKRVLKAGFTGIEKKYFATQWGLNHLFVAFKE
ncbi:MAG: class I SAM-dependent methyltransferase [Anaerolineaceae bacterium]|nr:class I SAM-dependent methyltransferase [Anaerolineaceae bacterium]